MDQKVEFYRHSLSAQDASAVASVLDSPFLTTGAVCRRVEAMLCNSFGCKHAFTTNSWTNGALAALLALKIGPGDDVVVPAMTFIATANAVELAGARAVFADVDPETLLLTPATLARALTPRTRAVMPVHLYGQMCDMPGIRDALPGGREIALIEDAAHAFESSRGGDLPGRYSDLAIFSFYATKNVTCGEGGAIITNRGDLADRLHSARLHGMTKGAADRFSGGRYNHWDMVSLGAKANLPDVLAALLPAQIETVRARLPQRQALANRYREAFSGLPIRLQRILPGCSTAEHLFPIHVDPAVRDEAILALNARGIGVTVNYRAVPLTTYYRDKYGLRREEFPVSAEWGEGALSLPLYPLLALEQQNYVIKTVKEAVVPLIQHTTTE